MVRVHDLLLDRAQYTARAFGFAIASASLAFADGITGALLLLVHLCFAHLQC